MSEHAFLAPSSAARWVQCAQSASLEAAYPETEPSQSSLEGTAAHWAVQRCLEGQPPTIGQQAPNGIAIDAEMLEAAEIVVDDIMRTLGPSWFDVLLIEEPVTIKRVHPSQNWGTPDYRAWNPNRAQNGLVVLNVWDYKYGHGIVEAFENWQMIDYVAGILGEANVNGLQDQHIIVDMCVIQPRAFHRDGPVRRWRVMASDLRAYFNRLEMAADDATSAQPTASPSPSACRDCKGRAHCEANQRAAYFAADMGKHYAPVDMSPHALGLELRALKRARGVLDARISGLEEEARATIKRGQLVPFWALESVPGRLSWLKPAPEIVALGQMLGINLAKPLDVITPTQAKKAGLPESIVNAYAARPTGAIELVEDDGKKARLTFSSSVA